MGRVCIAASSIWRRSTPGSARSARGRRSATWCSTRSAPLRSFPVMSRSSAGSAPRSSRDFDGVAATTGSACHSGRIELSPVLEAMGVAPEVGGGAVRFSLGRATTRDEIDYVVQRLTDAVATTG